MFYYFILRACRTEKNLNNNLFQEFMLKAMLKIKCPKDIKDNFQTDDIQEVHNVEELSLYLCDFVLN